MTRLRIIAWPGFRHPNPYTRLLYTHLPEEIEVEDFSIGLFLRHRFDVWHVHWPEYILSRPNLIAVLPRLIGFLFLLFVSRHRGTKIVWTIHNLQSHEHYHPRVENWLHRRMIRQMDGVISLSNAALEAALTRHPALRTVPAFVIPIGHYRGVYEDLTTQADARRALAIPLSAHVVTFFGLIRPYKNVPVLIRAFRRIPDPMAMLVIAGRPSSDSVALEIKRAAEGDRRIRLDLAFIPSEKVQAYLRAADLVALPFFEVLNSSSAVLALSFDRPVLVPSMGSLGELCDTVGAAWVRLYSGQLLPSVLSSALKWAKHDRPVERPDLSALDWTVVGTRTAEAYRAICGRSPR